MDNYRSSLANSSVRDCKKRTKQITLKQAVKQTQGRAELEASGNITLENISDIASTGVDYISTGAITKHIRAVDLSLRVTG